MTGWRQVTGKLVGDRWSRSEFLVRDGQDRRFSRESA
nr:MAG TPA: hypothetical protein [Caudoviricetes sp.]